MLPNYFLQLTCIVSTKILAVFTSASVYHFPQIFVPPHTHSLKKLLHSISFREVFLLCSLIMYFASLDISEFSLINFLCLITVDYIKIILAIKSYCKLHCRHLIVDWLTECKTTESMTHMTHMIIKAMSHILTNSN